MVAKSVKWALASLVIFPPAAFALGLGDVRLLSALNAPLDAEIEVLGATPEDMATLKAQIASSEMFARYGLDRPAVLNGVTMTASKNAAGKEVIRLRTAEAITEPFLTMLVEVNSARNRLVREYDLLLDPPVYTPGPQVADAPVAAPSTSDSARAGQIARPSATPSTARAQEPASSLGNESPPSPSPSAGAAPAPSLGEGSTRTVRRGDTLSGIATEVSGADAPGSRAWMLAIYQNNPAAFDGNMNVMRSGSVLRIPDSASVAAISPGEAGAEIRRQWSAWRGSGPASGGESTPTDRGQLRLVTPGELGGAGADTGAASAESSRLQGRVRELQAQLDESRRLLELKNSEVAQLQARLSSQQSSSAAPPPAREPPSASAQPTPPPAETAPAESPPAQGSAVEPAPAAAEPPPEAQPARKPVAAETPAPQQSGSIFDTLAEYWWVGAALVVALLAFFGLRAFRSRQRNEFDDSLSRLAASNAGAAALDRGDFGSDTQPLRAGAGGAAREAAFVVEESGTHERPRFGGEAQSSPRNVSADDTISSETAINLDQGDPLAEADFHMAYGLYDQAADLVRIAISREPGRRDLKLKLLEVFFVWGNKEQFLQTARELAETRDRAQSGEWEKIVIMGKQLAPEDPLFAGGGGGGGSASFGGVDLDLEGGQSRVDFDLLGEPVPGGNDIDLDIGSALGEGDGQTVTDAALALHDEGYTNGTGTQTTRQMTQKIRSEEPTVATYGGDFEAPTVEQPALYGSSNPTVRQKVETAMKHGNAAEQTAELAIDDLGLDLSSLDTMDQPGIGAAEEGPTLVAGLDERSRRIMDEAERRGMRDPDATAISATGSWNLADNDLDATMPPQRVGYQNGADEDIDLSETSRLRAVKGKGLDFDFNDEAPPRRKTNGSGTAVDLDVGTVTVPDTAFTATQKLNSEDLALPDMEPVTMSEVGTKLDLARAYMDMGDPEGARNILEEVMQEGSVAQKQEAQRLIESLPG
jgi:pilus assembly protein FimV